jgi:hypothetical protein
MDAAHISRMFYNNRIKIKISYFIAHSFYIDMMFTIYQ